ncbi:NUDIX hydrolase-like domain superfamily [Sesbania bispinosa]|nr:NUDIX hydrolase-like domain superfamily [Sesbania bispinosa]
MGEEVGVTAANSLHHQNSETDDQSLQLDIYPLSSYYFGSKDAIPFRDHSLADRIQRMKSNYAARGMRTCVEAVILVELFKHPHLLLLQVRNSFFKLPGGRLRPGESDTDGLKRKLARKLSLNEDGDGAEWEVGECLGMWWRPDFETLMYPFLPPNIKQPKECTKLFLVKLPESRKFIVPKNLRLLSVPLCQVHENHKVWTMDLHQSWKVSRVSRHSIWYTDNSIIEPSQFSVVIEISICG